jgi:hypothetical protein
MWWGDEVKKCRKEIDDCQAAPPPFNNILISSHLPPSFPLLSPNRQTFPVNTISDMELIQQTRRDMTREDQARD